MSKVAEYAMVAWCPFNERGIPNLGTSFSGFCSYMETLEKGGTFLGMARSQHIHHLFQCLQSTKDQRQTLNAHRHRNAKRWAKDAPPDYSGDFASLLSALKNNKQAYDDSGGGEIDELGLTPDERREAAERIDIERQMFELDKSHSRQDTIDEHRNEYINRTVSCYHTSSSVFLVFSFLACTMPVQRSLHMCD
jgi:hypothetical protein